LRCRRLRPRRRVELRSSQLRKRPANGLLPHRVRQDRPHRPRRSAKIDPSDSNGPSAKIDRTAKTGPSVRREANALNALNALRELTALSGRRVTSDVIAKSEPIGQIDPFDQRANHARWMNLRSSNVNRRHRPKRPNRRQRRAGLV
jgi:hypothetical protein